MAYHKPMLGVAAATLLAFLPCAARAQAAPSPSPSPSAPPEIGHVVTSDRQNEPLQKTAKTTYVVTKAEIVARGYQSVAAALTTIPGIVVEQYGALGALASVSIRGASPAQVLILVDGRPAGGAETETLDLGEFSTSGVERIEVVEGGGSTLYGDRAVGGVINIITTPAANAAPLVKLSTGSFDTNAVDFESRYLTFERVAAGNDYGFVSGAIPGGNRIDDDFEDTTARLRDSTKIGAVGLDASLGLSSVHLGVPGPLEYPFLPSPAPAVTPNPALAASYQSSTTRQNTETEDARLTFSLQRSISTTTLDLSATRQSLLFYSSPGDYNGCYNAFVVQPCSDLDDDARVQASLRQAFTTADNRLLFGVDLARDVARIDAGGVPPPINAFAETALYAQESRDFGTATAYAGLRAERDGAQGGAISPSAGFVERFARDWSVRGNYATAFRAPTAVDLYYPGFANPSLQPERMQTTDLTLDYESASGGIAAGPFTQTGVNLIEPNASFTQEINVGRVSIGGATLDAHTRPMNGITVHAGVTDVYRALDLTTVAVRLPRRPVFSTSLAVEYAATAPRAVLSAAGLIARAVGASPPYAPPDAPYDPYLNANAYTTVDGYVRFRLAPIALLSLRASNLGDERYAAVAGYPAPGRSFWVEVSTR